jgi:hypothetical protein
MSPGDDGRNLLRCLYFHPTGLSEAGYKKRREEGPPMKLLDQVRQLLRTRRYALRTEECYLRVRREARWWNGRRAQARSPAARTGGRRVVGP